MSAAAARLVKSVICLVQAGIGPAATGQMDEGRFDAWLASLDERHLADLRPPEVARALRALSSCYVERRGKLASGARSRARETRGLRALLRAPALPGHAGGRAGDFLTPRRRSPHWSISAAGPAAAGAAWAVEGGRPAHRRLRSTPLGGRRSELDVPRARPCGRATRVDVVARRLRAGRGDADPRGLHRSTSCPMTRDAAAAAPARRARARRARARSSSRSPGAWRRGGPRWAEAFSRAGGRADEWRFPTPSAAAAARAGKGRRASIRASSPPAAVCRW